MKGKHLITTDKWFFAPDGKQYKSVWGDVEILGDNILGIKTNARSSNWYAKVGSESNYVIVAGCQIHYAVRCEEKPSNDLVKDFATNDGDIKEFERPSYIYIAE